MREESQTSLPYDAAREVLQVEAAQIARACGLDAARVSRILESTARDYYGNPLPAPAPGVDTLYQGLSFSPDLREALD